MRLVAVVFQFILFGSFCFANSNDFLILKDDLNNDGVSDRIILGSSNIIGSFQSTNHNGHLDTFYIKNGNRSMLYVGQEKLGGPFIKLTEDDGIFSVVTLLKAEKGKFKTVAASFFINEVQFSDASCPSFSSSNKSLHEKLTLFADDIKSNKISEIVDRALDPQCKSNFGSEYPKLKKQIEYAMGVSNGVPEKNNLISCLNDKAPTLAAIFKANLVGHLFDSFKILCPKINDSKPSASYDSVTGKFSLNKTIPEDKNRNFAFDFFHELLHSCAAGSESDIKSLVEKCAAPANSTTKRDHTFPSNLDFQSVQAQLKDGTVIRLPAQDFQQPVDPAPVNALISAVTPMVNTSAPPDDEGYQTIESGSRAALGSMSPLMNASFAAAVPAAFGSDGNSQGSSNVNPFQSSSGALAKGLAGNSAGTISTDSSSPSSPAGGGSTARSGAAAVDSSLESATASGAPSAAPSAARGIASVPTDRSAQTAGGVSPGGARSSAGSIGGGSALSPDAQRSQRLAANVPGLRERQQFRDALFQIHDYKTLKAILTNKQNEPYMVADGIEYVAITKNATKRGNIQNPKLIFVDNGERITKRNAQNINQGSSL